MSNLPYQLASSSALFTFLGVGTAERVFLEKYVNFRYRAVAIPKRRGGKRVLLVPEKRLKFLQRKVLGLFKKLYSPRAPVHGFIEKRSCLTNAAAHQRRNYLLNIDLKNFFGTITSRRIFGLFKALGMQDDVAQALCTICTVKNQLPQGAPTSPILANMISFGLDRDFVSFAKAGRMRYTRYADDISLSSYVTPHSLFQGDFPSEGKVPSEKLSTALLNLIHSNGFDLNPEKVWFSGPKSRKEVTGLIVNEFPNVKRNFVRNIRAALFKIEKIGLSEAQKDYEKRSKNIVPLAYVLRGRLEWIAQVRGRSFSAYRSLGVKYNLLFPNSGLPIDPTNQEIAELAVWVIEFFFENDCAQGTAFFLEDLGLVTANHVLEKMPIDIWADIYRPSNPSQKFRAKISACKCEHRDLAILEHNIPPESYRSLSCTTSPGKNNENIVALGFPEFAQGDTLGFRQGHTIGKATRSGVKLIEISATLSSGISGGPIVNDRYEVIAVAKRGGSDQPKQIAIDISELLKLSQEQAILKISPPSQALL